MQLEIAVEMMTYQLRRTLLFQALQTNTDTDIIRTLDHPHFDHEGVEMAMVLDPDTVRMSTIDYLVSSKGLSYGMIFNQLASRHSHSDHSDRAYMILNGCLTKSMMLERGSAVSASFWSHMMECQQRFHCSEADSRMRSWMRRHRLR